MPWGFSLRFGSSWPTCEFSTLREQDPVCWDSPSGSSLDALSHYLLSLPRAPSRQGSLACSLGGLDAQGVSQQPGTPVGCRICRGGFDLCCWADFLLWRASEPNP